VSDSGCGGQYTTLDTLPLLSTLLLEVNQQNVLQVEVRFIDSYLVMQEQGTKNTFTSSGYKVLVNYSQRD
jgi:hypothetical protein